MNTTQLLAEFRAAYRDYVTDGIPATGEHEPVKSEIRIAFASLINFIEGLVTSDGSGALVYAEKSDMDADLAHAADTMAWVLADDLPENNGIYKKLLGSGSGSWDFQSAFSFQPAIDAAVVAAEAEIAAATILQVGILNGAVPGVVFPTAAATNVPRGVLNATISAAGSGGTNGTFALAWTGGNFSANPIGTFTVSGGAVTAITIAEPGLYIGASPTAPTPVFSASSGLSGASGTPVVGFRVASGSYYWVRAADGLNLDLYLNNAGTATATSPLIQAPLTAAVTNTVGVQTARVTSNTESWREGQTLAYSLDHTVAFWDHWDPGSGGAQGRFDQDGSNSRIHASWKTDQLGFAESGFLIDLEIHTGQWARGVGSPPALTTTTGAKVQAWVMRPTATLPTTAVSMTANRVATIGEIALPDGQTDVRDHVKWSGLNIPVQAGDFIAFRIIAAGTRFLSGTGGVFDTFCSVQFNDTDLDIATAMATAKTANVVTTAARRSFLHRATVVKSDHLAADNVPRGRLKLNAAARIPRHISREADNPWFGKKIALLGSSISTYAGGGSGAVKGHWPRVFEALGCDAHIFAVGSGFGLWPASTGTPAAFFISGTEAEFVARYGAGGDPGQHSYERRILGQGFDAVIFPDLINDTNAPATYSVGTQGSTDRSTLWGAFQRMSDAMVADNPDIMIFLQSPAHRWANYGGSGVPTEQANRITFTDGMIAFGDWNGWPVIDFIRNGGISAARVAAGVGLIDNIHPSTSLGARQQMARYAYSVMVRHGAGEFAS
jgi:hypothetical protein